MRDCSHTTLDEASDKGYKFEARVADSRPLAPIEDKMWKARISQFISKMRPSNAPVRHRNINTLDCKSKQIHPKGTRARSSQNI